jgi:transposase
MAMRMVLYHEDDYPSRWATMVWVAKKISHAPPQLYEWVRKADLDSSKRWGW